MSRILAQLRSRAITSRSFVTAQIVRANEAGGFGEEERQKKGKEPVKDSAPYQNEYTKSGTNSEVAHEEESYSRNTNPEESNRRQGEALDSSPANASASRNAEPNKSNKTHGDNTQSSGYSQKRTESSTKSEDTSKSKFEKISKGHDDIQTVGGRKVDN